jgi:hypothetical protein
LSDDTRPSWNAFIDAAHAALGATELVLALLPELPQAVAPTSAPATRHPNAIRLIPITASKATDACGFADRTART